MLYNRRCRKTKLSYLFTFCFISSISGSAGNSKTYGLNAVRKQKMGVIKEKKTRSKSAQADTSCLLQQCHKRLTSGPWKAQSLSLPLGWSCRICDSSICFSRIRFRRIRTEAVRSGSDSCSRCNHHFRQRYCRFRSSSSKAGSR